MSPEGGFVLMVLLWCVIMFVCHLLDMRDAVKERKEWE